MANETLLVPGPIAGAGLPGLIFVLADDSGDGFSLRGSGNSDNPARRCRPARTKVTACLFFRNPAAGGRRWRACVSPNCVRGGLYMWKGAKVAAALVLLAACAADEEQRKAQKKELAKAAAEAAAAVPAR